VNQNVTYERLIALFDQHGARYRLIDHAPEGRTEHVSPLRGNAVEQAAKCIILLIKQGKKVTKYVLGVVPGNARIDRDAIKAATNATYVAFAPAEAAEELAGSVVGTVLPFAFDPRLELIADPGLMAHSELYFNAARLDRSVALNTEDYVRLAKPRFVRIAAPGN
jgi:Ala-tRNA(Pro) deacylase